MDKTLTEHFDRLNDLLPVVVVVPLWLIALPVRLLALLLLPHGAVEKWHKLHKLHNFFAFDFD